MRVNKTNVVQSTNLKKPIIHNVFIIDRSGSMSGSKYISAIKSVKTELELLSKDENSVFKNYVVEFDNSYEQPLRIKTHLWNSLDTQFKEAGASGGTPLYNTMGTIFKKLESELKSDDRVLIKIFTDGGDTDNNKGEWNSNSIGVYTNKLININKWTITVNCTLTDKYAILKMGIPESNILCHNNTAEDIERVSSLRTMSSLSYSKSVSMNVSADELKSNFYSKSI